MIKLCYFFCIFLAACSTSDRSSAKARKGDQVKVLSTIAMIDDLVKEIGGEHVQRNVLIKGELDPHSYQLVKGDDEKLAEADVIFYNGLGLEHGPSLQSYLTSHKNAIGVGNIILEKNPELILKYNGQIDPHIWLDVSMWMRVVPLIVNALSQKDPKNEPFFKENGEKLLEKMAEVHNSIKTEMKEIPSHQRFLVSSHDAFNYFTRAYLAEDDEKTQQEWQKRFAAPEGLAPESQLSVSEIQFIIDHLAQHQIHVIFPESNVSKDSIRKIIQAGKEKGLNLKMATDVLYADAMGKPGSDGDSYLKMIKHDGKIIAKYLRSNHP